MMNHLKASLGCLSLEIINYLIISSCANHISLYNLTFLYDKILVTILILFSTSLLLINPQRSLLGNVSNIIQKYIC